MSEIVKSYFDVIKNISNHFSVREFFSNIRFRNFTSPINLSLLFSAFLGYYYKTDNKNQVVKEKFLTMGQKERYALLIGNDNNNNSKIRTTGCSEDVRIVKKMLMEKYGFLEKNILMILDDPADRRSYKPTLVTIKKSLKLLLSYLKKNNEKIFFIYYSGLGGEVDNLNFKGKPEQDECWVPSDFEINGVISMNFLANYFLNSLDEKTTCIIVSDTCHRNSLRPINYYYNHINDKWIHNNNLIISKAKILVISSFLENDVENRISGVIAFCLSKFLEFNSFEEFIRISNQECRLLGVSRILLMTSNQENLGRFSL